MKASSAPTPTARRNSRSRSKRSSTCWRRSSSKTRIWPGPARLGVVHGHIGVAQIELAHVVGIEEGDADGRRHRDAVVAHRERFGQGELDALGQPDDGADLVGLLGQHHELVTTVAGHEIGIARGPHDPVGHLAQHVVAHLVPERVVDRLEPVEVDEKQPDAVARPLGPGGGSLELADQDRPIGQPRQVIVRGLVGQALGGLREVLRALLGVGDAGAQRSVLPSQPHEGAAGAHQCEQEEGRRGHIVSLPSPADRIGDEGPVGSADVR